MQSFLLGLTALVIVLYLMQAFTRANPSVLVRQIRRTAGMMALAAAAGLAFRGLLNYALPLGVLGTWLLWGHWGLPWTRPRGASKPTGKTTRVVTDHLQVELDHQTGAVHGHILKGRFAGRELDDLKPAEVAEAWQDFRFTDPRSAQILEGYLDRMHPSWREDVARSAGARPGPDRRMTREEAFEILGLEPGAGADDIRRAHRDLMQKLHPDRGGSTYLAAKINEARDVLLGQGP